MIEKSAISMMALQKTIQQSLKKPEAKQACLSFEYKLLLLYSAQFGIYIMPQLDTLDVWHGVVFIRYGLFKDAKFKFKITFKEFPHRSPQVCFVSDVYHPLVRLGTGELDLQEISKNWNYGSQHLIFTVVERIRLIFIDVKKYEKVDSYNTTAGGQFKNAIEQFYLKVRESVDFSKTQLYQNYPESSLKFMPFNEKHKKMKDALSQICEEQGLTPEDKKKKFMRILKE